jgi:hypothetical protein
MSQGSNASLPIVALASAGTKGKGQSPAQLDIMQETLRILMSTVMFAAPAAVTTQHQQQGHQAKCIVCTSPGWVHNPLD